MSRDASSSKAPSFRRACSSRVVAPGDLRPADLLAAFFLLGVTYLVAGAAAGVVHGVTGVGQGRWLALHLAFVGGVSQLALGASQFFVGAFLATGPPRRWVVRAQLALWNLGTLVLAVGVPAGIAPAAVAGGLLLLGGLALHAAGLRAMQRRSLQRARWAVRWYYACAAFLVPGVGAGILLAGGTAWSSGDLLGAHLALNLVGWFGTAIVGTLHTFLPSLTETRLTFQRLEPATFAGWILGVAALAGGYGFGVPAVAAGGWIALLVAAGCLAVNVAASMRAGRRPPALPARLLALGQGFLLAGLLAAVGATLLDGAAAPVAASARTPLAVLLLAGWLGLTVLGSLLHLLSVLRRVRGGRGLPPPRPAHDRALVCAAGIGITTLAAAPALGAPAAVAPAAVTVVAVYGLLGTKVLYVAFEALGVTRPSI
ncbi:MAG: hypothetical protein ACR2ML_13410 [Solirubrobacteraceae bacterium]